VEIGGRREGERKGAKRGKRGKPVFYILFLMQGGVGEKKKLGQVIGTICCRCLRRGEKGG